MVQGPVSLAYSLLESAGRDPANVMTMFRAVLISLLWLECSPFAIGATNTSWQTWGPYRPNLYFGVRPAIPESFLMGLMWAKGDDSNSILETLRDTCEQNDGMGAYGWSTYDPRIGGSQVLHDDKLQVDLTTDFIKSESGDSWAVRLTGRTRSDGPQNAETAVIFHYAFEQASQDRAMMIKCDSKDANKRSEAEDVVVCLGEATSLGSFNLHVAGDATNKVKDRLTVRKVFVSEDRIWQAKSVFSAMIEMSGLESINEPDSKVANMHFIQTTFSGDFVVTFTYTGANTTALNVNAIERSISNLESTFSSAVDAVFPRTDPFLDESYRRLLQALLSNLLGGLGFFYGDSKVDSSHSPEYQETDLNFWEKAAAAAGKAQIARTVPTSLLTFTPSRPFFPRGFLWDEGFHLLPIIEWDLDLAVSVVRSWLHLMDEDGWIAREQILGPEARSKVPDQFQVQYPHYANPPTLSLLFPILISKLTGKSAYNGHPSVYNQSPAEAAAMLKELYPLLSRHYRWFRRTQAGDFGKLYPRPEGAVHGEGYRWRGRTPMHTLTSGLDDYPRANPPHPGELHVDALAWVGASAHALQQVAEYLGEDADSAMYKRHLDNVKGNLDTLHWSADEQAYCDATVEGTTYKLICHEGYVSLFPLLLGLLDAQHPNLPAVLDLLSDPARLWSPHGLRSLSAADPDYGKDEDYWRGAIWMNLNVLAVLRLRDLGTKPHGRGGSRELLQTRALALASELRKFLVDTVHSSWEKTGFAWEQYSDTTGEGSHSRAFTGWTACVILLMGLDLEGSMSQGQGRELSASVSLWSIIVATAIVAIVARFWRPLRILWIRSIQLLRRHKTREARYRQVIDLDEYPLERNIKYNR